MTRFAFAVVIVILAGLLFFTEDLNLFEKPSAPEIGRIQETQGLVLGQVQESEGFVSLKARSPISGPLKIVTGFDSYAQLSFGEDFRVLGNSAVTLYKRANKHFIEVRRGSIERKAPQPLVEFQVAGEPKQGLIISAPQTGPIVQLRANPVVAGGITAPPSESLQRLLHETFGLHQRFLEKCFIKLYEKQKGQLDNGRVLTRFKINNKGRVEDVAIIESEYNDSDFETCVSEVISRIQFKGYTEQPRTIEFPLQFELPY